MAFKSSLVLSMYLERKIYRLGIYLVIQWVWSHNNGLAHSET